MKYFIMLFLLVSSLGFSAITDIHTTADRNKAQISFKTTEMSRAELFIAEQEFSKPDEADTYSFAILNLEEDTAYPYSITDGLTTFSAQITTKTYLTCDLTKDQEKCIEALNSGLIEVFIQRLDETSISALKKLGVKYVVNELQKKYSGEILIRELNHALETDDLPNYDPALPELTPDDRIELFLKFNTVAKDILLQELTEYQDKINALIAE